MCGIKASGVVKDFYPNGVIRMEGTFLDGIPTSDIRFYNIKGRLVSKQIYKSGHYIDTKLYHNKDKTDYY
jgi:antitoxin component YwqK of YwqJK toxin-antitoxin module